MWALDAAGHFICKPIVDTSIQQQKLCQSSWRENWLAGDGTILAEGLAAWIS